MKNKLTDLQNHLFELMEKLNDDGLTGGELDEEVKRSDAFSGLAELAIKNAALIAKCAEVYGIPITGDLPLLPLNPGVITPKKMPEKHLNKKMAALLDKLGDE